MDFSIFLGHSGQQAGHRRPVAAAKFDACINSPVYTTIHCGACDWLLMIADYWTGGRGLTLKIRPNEYQNFPKCVPNFSIKSLKNVLKFELNCPLKSTENFTKKFQSAGIWEPKKPSSYKVCDLYPQ